MQIFSFPLNLILALLWVGGTIWLWINKRKSLFVEFLLSKGATLWGIGIFLIFCLVIGITGRRELTKSWFFIILMLYLQTTLFLVILRGWRAKTATGAALGPIRWRFLVNHLGLLIAVSSAFWGYPDSETLRIQAFRDTPSREAFGMDGSSVWLKYDIVLNELKTEKYENGLPAMYQADLSVDGKTVSIKVNEPYSKGFGEDIYLVSYDAESGQDPAYCILEIVKEPWKYGALAGIIMMLAGALMLFLCGPSIKGEDN